MADVVVQEDGEIFVYTGGYQVVPRDVRRVRIHKSVTVIPQSVFEYLKRLIYVEFHNGIEIIEAEAFYGCISLRSIKLLGVKFIKERAFSRCRGLLEVEFDDTLETIGHCAFYYCSSLRSIMMPSVRNIGEWAFDGCEQLTDLELPEGLETIGQRAFHCCHKLKQIAMPLKRDMISAYVFAQCLNLTALDIVGGVHRTIASLHLESWKNQMKDEINRINQVLPTIGAGKTAAVQQWMELVTRRLNRYKAEHKALLKEATTLLELALWKTNLDDKNGGVLEEEGVRTTRGKRKRARKDRSVTSGASIVIKNVLPFLQLE